MQPIMDSSFSWESFSHSTAISAARGGGLLPPTTPGFQLPPPAAGFEHFPVDSGLVERAVRSSSCFGGGNGTVSAGAFTAAESISPANAYDDDASALGDCSSDSRKRRRSNEVIGTDQAKASSASADSANETERSKGAKGEETGLTAAATATATGRSKGKGAKEADEPQKEGYIHVRARKGQATNSHSLAERLRREKISERMKLLQDLVPGCSKVTGKAVMLDEIINYVQCLQRQVEFLSMKLATVNPRLDLNLESLLSKDGSHRILVLPGDDAQTTAIAIRHAPGRCPWHGQSRCAQNSHAGATKRGRVQRACISDASHNGWTIPWCGANGVSVSHRFARHEHKARSGWISYVKSSLHGWSASSQQSADREAGP